MESYGDRRGFVTGGSSTRPPGSSWPTSLSTRCSSGTCGIREAFEAGVVEPNAMVLSTVDLHGMPGRPSVLVRDADRFGFTFFTNYESVKSHQLTARPVASATFAWLDLHRQVQGTRHRRAGQRSRERRVLRVAPAAEPDRSMGVAAVGGDPRSARTDGARRRTREAVRRQAVPRPAHWGGWRLVPEEWEFWQGRPSRLHDRFRYRPVDDDWKIERLAP